ncbi:MAG TPA: type I secretion system permease/ATPase [Amaricoccus sp.]|uniref:type I secretion system permease/ATPase n=1 Tax=Amaricoccus sp. TaxID=1872485 RepID=UPI002B987D44|nr:type I secretion system permease/ATPase [Amaricoccus sp.]HMQ93765.1 type I secretion system permease/ATPase [Amaricoccus sp.]HMR52950.1 type I secretion system permease/ATPase [Amaricoccus sp.]HMR59481.1 type I secretion system permease/ATPase [Amaricoccus sp.]HMT99845.1 type I secretion system permease/ATPase [Amaricoccus sp.]
MKRAPTGPEAGFVGMSGLFWTVAIFSVFVNLLMLTGSIYMLQIYDRVLPSRSEETLLALTLLIAALFALMGVLDYARGRISARIGAVAQTRLDGRVFRATLRRSVLSSERSRPATGLKDLESVQRLMASPVLFAVFDMPWAPVFIALIYSFHPWLGHLSLIGGAILVVITLLNQWLTRKPEAEANAAMMDGDGFAETIRQQGDMIQALGMRGAVQARWQTLRNRALAAQLTSTDRVSQFSTLSKTFRFFLQSAVLGLGAYLVLQGEMSAGMMIAASILLGRALAPVEQAIGGWPLVQRARRGWAQLKTLLEQTPDLATPTALPRPRAFVDVKEITVFPPEQQKATLRMLSFHVSPGQALGVIGPSASGKSTLARVLTGIWRPASGSVRLDGATLDQYEPDILGSYIGYLPQDVVLFDGTVAENIGRLLPNPDPAEVVTAARKAGAHEMILNLPQGYDTSVSAGGARLSGGQKQRIGLARAFYGNPQVLVLDEPNSNLDAAGQDALNEAIRLAKADGKLVIIMAHRPAGIAECDTILILDGGIAKAFGPRDEVLKAHVRNYAQVAGRIAPEAQQ